MKKIYKAFWGLAIVFIIFFNLNVISAASSISLNDIFSQGEGWFENASSRVGRSR